MGIFFQDPPETWAYSHFSFQVILSISPKLELNQTCSRFVLWTWIRDSSKQREEMQESHNGMGNDPFVDFPAGCWLLALGIHATPPTLLFPSGYRIWWMIRICYSRALERRRLSSIAVLIPITIFVPFHNTATTKAAPFDCEWAPSVSLSQHSLFPFLAPFRIAKWRAPRTSTFDTGAGKVGCAWCWYSPWWPECGIYHVSAVLLFTFEDCKTIQSIQKSIQNVINSTPCWWLCLAG